MLGNPFRQRCLKLLTLALVINLYGCAHEAVKPWQREILSQPHMQPGADPMLKYAEDKIYFSREASQGAASFGGGGCGCN